MRHSPRYQKGQTLIIIFFGMLFFGGSVLIGGVFATGKSVHELRKEIKHLVQDERRLAAADAVLKDWDKSSGAYISARKDYSKEILALLERHDAGQADFDAYFSRLDQVNQKALDNMLKQRQALRATLTADEWRQLFAPAEKP